MSLLRSVVLITALAALPAMAHAAGTPEHEHRPSKLEAALEHALATGSKLSALRIEAGGKVARDVRQLTIYGRGLGIWNRERQFELDPAEVKRAIRIVLDHHLCTLPDEIGGEEEGEEEHEIDEEKERPPHRRERSEAGANPISLLRTLTITFGDLSKTVIQEAPVPEAAPLEKGLAELAELCRKPAVRGRTAHSLKEGLTLLAKGTLAPETLTLTVNAPRLRSLKDNSSQGWILRIEHGRIFAQSHDLKMGYRTLANRRLDPEEVRTLAKDLLAQHVETLPRQINVPGYLDLRIDVLSNRTQILARTYAGTPGPEAVQAAKRYAAVRNVLRSLWKSAVDPPARSPAPASTGDGTAPKS
ncbi:MAG TPA: hypothetical protein ENK19_04165 [Acidobacteria bacterium]|nr:hypothetical protein [Acidobacteriota bacterium]